MLSELAAGQNEELRAEISMRRAWFGFQSGLAAEAIGFADLAVSIWQAMAEPAREAKARSIRAWLYLEVGRGEEAAKEAMEALRLAERGSDSAVLSWALNIVGVIYWYCMQLGRAEEYCIRAVALARETGDQLVLGWWLVNLGGVRHAMSVQPRNEENQAAHLVASRRAITDTEEALALAKGGDDLWGQALCLLNIAQYRLTIGDVSGSAELLDRFTNLAPVSSDRVLTHRLELESSLMLARHQPREALHLTETMLTIAKRIGNHESVVGGYRTLSAVHEQLGSFEQALECFKQYHVMQAQFAAERIQQSARIAEIFLEFDKLTAQIATAGLQQAEIVKSFELLERRTKSLTEDTRRDALTGVGNRRHLDDTLQTIELLDSRDYVIVMIDIDHFKSINDRFSHVVGDKVLIRIAQEIVTASRPGDLVARYGGEEFVLVMSSIDETAARSVCDRIRRAIHAIDWSAYSSGLTVTASFGFASSAEVFGGALDVLALADRYLYRAKQAGRDCVIGHDPRAAS
ncbi:MAG: diguanylate cyclase [Janthinobacterium lividum]